MLFNVLEGSEKIRLLAKETYGLTFEEKTTGDSVVLTAKKPISKEAYLGVRKKKDAIFELIISKTSVTVSVTAEDLIVHNDPSCYWDYQSKEAFDVSNDRKKLMAVLESEKLMTHGFDLIFDKMYALELSMDMNIRIHVTKENEEKFLKKKVKMQKKGFSKPDSEVFHMIKEIVLSDMNRRLCNTVRKYKKQRIVTTRETAEAAMRFYFADIMLEFEMEKDEHVNAKYLHDILYGYRKLGNPIPKCTNIYALDGLTAGQWVYCYYYAIKGEAWFDYKDYCSKYDRLEEELLEAVFAPYMNEEGDEEDDK